MATAEQRAQSANQHTRQNTRQTARPTSKLAPDRANRTANTSAGRVGARATAVRHCHGRAKRDPLRTPTLRMEAMACAAVRRATSRRKSIVSGL